MPLSVSEFYRMVYGKNDASQHKATDVSYIPNDEFMELVWERGQIMMQGQSSKARKTPVSSNFQFHTSKVHEKESAGANASATATTASKIGRFVGIDSVLNVPLSGASIEMGVNQDDDMVPWFNYPIDDYCSDFLPEISGVTVENDFNLIDKREGCNQPDKDLLSHNVSLDHGVSLDQLNTSKVSSSSRTSLLFPWSLHQAQISAPSLRSGISDIGSNNSRANNPNNVTYEDSIHGQGCSGGLSQMKMQNKDSGLPCSSSSLLNFSHFSRPATIARASLQNGGSVLADSGSSGLGIMGNNGKQATLNAADCRPHKEMAFLSHSPLIPGKVDSSPSASKPFDESRPVEKSDTICREDGANNEKLGANVVLDASESKAGGPDTEKGIEPIGASSSVCSGNSAERASNDLTKNLKRRSREMEDSECQSENVEQESVGIKKPTPSRGGTGSKRSRAAEVHNLSERRRRDRINEKMRALQELIPNCNKVDKASMLDEAIEYLKTLQLQVQIMSMGAGLCMSPMMFSTGMQHIHPAHVPHFSPMGVGMGIGMGYGMGMRMIDMNGGSQGHRPMIPLLPPTQGPRYPSPAISGLTNFQGIPGSNLQVFGHPGQGMPISFPPPIARPPTNLSVISMGAHEEVLNPTSSLNEKELMRNSNSVVITQTLELDAANESLDQSAMVEKKDQVPDIGHSTAASPNTRPADCD